MKTIGNTLLLIALIALTQQAAWAGKRDYQKADTYADESAWYVGSWAGTNTAFDPPLAVEMTILPSGEIYTDAHGEGKSYHVTTRKKIVKVHKLKDTPMRGKVINPATFMLEDGGKLSVAKTGSELQTTVPDLGIVVQYRPATDTELVAIQARVAAQAEEEAHHKDHDFWHSPEFWGAVAAGAVSSAHDYDDHVEVVNPGITAADEEALRKYYK